jgi:hypothetical protein
MFRAELQIRLNGAILLLVGELVTYCNSSADVRGKLVTYCNSSADSRGELATCCNLSADSCGELATYCNLSADDRGELATCCNSSADSRGELATYCNSSADSRGELATGCSSPADVAGDLYRPLTVAGGFCYMSQNSFSVKKYLYFFNNLQQDLLSSFFHGFAAVSHILPMTTGSNPAFLLMSPVF